MNSGKAIARKPHSTEKAFAFGDYFPIGKVISQPKILLIAAVVVDVVVSIMLTPTTAMPYDFPNIIRAANQWLSWKMSLFLFWKFGADYSLFGVVTALGARSMESIGLPMPFALHASFKIWLVIANLATALILITLFTKYDKRRAFLAGAAWLINPMVIWVAGVDAQIEPVTALAIAAGLYLCEKKRWATAGFIAALGTGFEYLPLVVAVFAITLTLAGIIRKRDLAKFMAGLGLGLVASFGPIFANHIGRLSFYGGLIGSSVTVSTGKIVIFPGSIWWFYRKYSWDIEGAHYWYLFFGFITLGIIFLQAARLRKSGNSREGIVAVGLCLLAAILLYPQTLPQFILIADLGLLCLYTVAALSPVYIVFTGAIELIGWLLSTPIAYWFEDNYPSIWYNHPKTISTTSLSPAGASILLMAVGLLLLGLSCAVIMGSRYPNSTIAIVSNLRSALNVACMITCSVIIILLISWSITPEIWTAPFSNPNAQLYETTPAINNMPANQVIVRNGSVKAEFNSILAAAIMRAKVRPRGRLNYTPQVEYEQLNVGGVQKNPSVILPILDHIGNSISVSQIGVEWLVHEPQDFQFNDVRLTVSCSKTRITEEPTSFGTFIKSNPWREIGFKVNLKDCLSPSLQLWSVSGKPITVDASPLGTPWLIVWPTKGKIHSDLNGMPVSVFASPTLGTGSGHIDMSVQNLLNGKTPAPSSQLSAGVTGATIYWPNALTDLKRASSAGLLIGGGSVALALALFTTLVIRIINLTIDEDV